MNYKRNLMTGLIGLALLAMPIAAAAKDNDSGRNNAHQERDRRAVVAYVSPDQWVQIFTALDTRS